MIKIECYTCIDAARRLWQRHWPALGLFDLWPVRASFDNQYHHPPHFLVATDTAGRFQGMLALSWIEEVSRFGHFPGELWQGNTWLEQNRILASNSETLSRLLAEVPAEAIIRYIENDTGGASDRCHQVDETGYLFYPQAYNYCFETYWSGFAGKKRRKLRTELERLHTRGVSWRFNHRPDLNSLFDLNLETYQENSYFHDPRFLNAFRNLADWLQANQMLRLTTVLIGGQVAAVDMGAVWKRTYTLLAGGTRKDFPGVAKLINRQHLEWACARKITAVDFLCGNFNWKQGFRLTPRPLYRIHLQPEAIESATCHREIRVASAQ
jgi:hypothetical protein